MFCSNCTGAVWALHHNTEHTCTRTLACRFMSLSSTSRCSLAGRCGVDSCVKLTATGAALQRTGAGGLAGGAGLARGAAAAAGVALALPLLLLLLTVSSWSLLPAAAAAELLSAPHMLHAPAPEVVVVLLSALPACPWPVAAAASDSRASMTEVGLLLLPPAAVSVTSSGASAPACVIRHVLCWLPGCWCSCCRCSSSSSGWLCCPSAAVLGLQPLPW